MSSSASHKAIFGPYTLDLGSGELRKFDTKIKMGEQPFQILRMLMEHPGKMVSREELREKLWANDTFVDFDHGLNSAIRRLRDCLSDTAAKPRWIETIPRRGYRFVGYVKWADGEAAAAFESAAPQYEIPPEQEINGPVEVAVQGRQRFSSRTVALWSGAVGLLVLLSVAAILRSKATARPSHIRSIAVLPLDNLSGDQSQQYFADGMTEELITVLAKNPALRITSRTSVMQYRGIHRPLTQIARELGVDGVIEGSILSANGRLRLTAQLIDGASDTHLWSRSYERENTDAINLQRELALDISEEVGAELGAVEKNSLAAAMPVRPEAYDALFQGRFHLGHYTRSEISRAIEDFQQSIKLDPEFAPAYASLADAYIAERSVYVAPRDVMPEAKVAATKALELDETLPEAHSTLGDILMYYDYDWGGAEKQLKRAIELDPSFASAHASYGMLLTADRRFSEAKDQMLLARKLDPLSPLIAALFSVTLYNARDYNGSLQQAREAVALDPNFWLANAFMGLALQKTGDLPDAIKVLEHARELNDSPTILEMLGGVYAEAGRTADAKKVVDTMIHRSSEHYICPYEIATTLVGLNEREQAFDWLQKSVDARADCSPWMAADPKLDPLRRDPRFENLLKSIGLEPKGSPI